MSKTDDFDIYLKSSFQKANIIIKDEGFTENVVSNLHTIKLFSIKRNLILFLASFTSVLIFFFSNGYKSIIVSMIDIFNNGFQLIKPSVVSIFVISIFIGVFIYIFNIEYNRSTI
jgi:hypothetical protein